MRLDCVRRQMFRSDELRRSATRDGEELDANKDEANDGFGFYKRTMDALTLKRTERVVVET
ncbi:hypothetical protein Csa_011402, partial [Cucumis sativus]